MNIFIEPLRILFREKLLPPKSHSPTAENIRNVAQVIFVIPFARWELTAREFPGIGLRIFLYLFESYLNRKVTTFEELVNSTLANDIIVHGVVFNLLAMFLRFPGLRIPPHILLLCINIAVLAKIITHKPYLKIISYSNVLILACSLLAIATLAASIMIIKTSFFSSKPKKLRKKNTTNINITNTKPQREPPVKPTKRRASESTGKKKGKKKRASQPAAKKSKSKKSSKKETFTPRHKVSNS